MDELFDEYANIIESDVLNEDFDNIDLYGDKLLEEESDGFGEDIEYE